MKKILALICFVILSCSTFGQNSGNGASASAASSSSDANAAKKESKKTGIDIPPEKKSPVGIPKITIPMVINGKPDEEAWKNAAVFKDFYQTSPGDNIAPSKPTEVYVMYDELNMYIAFKCWDEKDKIRATVAKRDNVFGEDNVRVWLDTYDDRRRAYVLGFNPLGIQQDGIFTEGQGADFSVDIIMESKGVIEDWGWSVEVKIPFKSLRYAAGKGKNWGFNAARNIDRFNDEFDSWMPDDRSISGFLIKHGKISGLDDIKFEKTLEVVPSITLGQTSRRTRVFGPSGALVGDRWVNNPIKQDIGVTVKYTLSPNITLDAAYNPDFAEIEADAPVVTANQRFPIFFEEKRPFFLEGVDIFQSPLRIFHSRTIVDPDLAAKLTGKIGKTSFGFLAASDKAPGNYGEDDLNDTIRLPRINEFIDKNATFGVLRLKRDVGKENSLGFFSTYRSFVEQKNAVAGFDGRFKLSPKMVAQFQVVGTTSRRCFFDAEFEPTLNQIQAASNRAICGTGSFDPDLKIDDPSLLQNGSTYRQYRTGNGIGYYANLDYSTDQHGFFAEVGGRSKDYRADAGFTRRTNTNFAFFFNRFSTKSKPQAKIIRATWAQFTGIDFDWQGRLQSQNFGTNVSLNLAKSISLNVETGLAREKIYEEEFGLKRSPTRPLGTFFGDGFRETWQNYFSINFNQNFNKQLRYGFFLGHIRNSFDFFHFRPLPDNPDIFLQDPGPGKQYDGEIFAEYKPIDPLRFNLSYRKSRLVRNDDRSIPFDSDIVSVRTTYQFSRFVFTRVRIDYDSLSSNYAGQALFGWNPSPGTAFYVGYNDNFNYNGFNPNTGQFEPKFGRNSRTFFIRASYLFRKSF
ncbi:MAG: DUF5916 domain-containing protein [Pyrinomonadaceae bacterium]